MATTPNLGLSQLTEDENFDIDTYNGDNLKVDTFAGTIPTKRTLYSNENGSSSTIALNDSAANYNSVLISWIDNDNNTQPDIVAVNGKTTNINAVDVKADGITYIKSAIASVNGTAITFVSNRESYNGVISGSNVIKITKVVGVKGF